MFYLGTFLACFTAVWLAGSLTVRLVIGVVGPKESKFEAMLWSWAWLYMTLVLYIQSSKKK